MFAEVYNQYRQMCTVYMGDFLTCHLLLKMLCDISPPPPLPPLRKNSKYYLFCIVMVILDVVMGEY